MLQKLCRIRCRQDRHFYVNTFDMGHTVHCLIMTLIRIKSKIVCGGYD